MRALTWSVFALFVAAAIAYAQAPPADLQKARQARDAAQSAGNDQEWGRYTTDDFVVVSTTGALQTKAERMAEIKGNKTAPPERLDRKIRVYGDTVIETFVLNLQAGPARFTSVWVKQNGTWKVASVHQTLIAKKP